MTVREAIHTEPVWREKSNFIIATSVAINDIGIETEQLWARQIDQFHYEICCIPFFAYDLALGDVVEVDNNYLVTRVSNPSGRYVFRVYFARRSDSRGEIIGCLTDMGALLEWSSTKLLAVDARDAIHGQEIADFLFGCENNGQLTYETGRS